MIFTDQNREIILQFAESCLSDRTFKANQYTLLASVPVKCLTYQKSLFPSYKNRNCLPSDFADRSFDFVLCQDTHVLLAVTIDSRPKKTASLISSYLPNLPHLCCSAEPFQSEEAWDLLCERLLAVKPASSLYQLSFIALGTDPAPFQARRLLRANGSISPYGADTGLFLQFQSGQDDRVDVRIGTALQSYGAAQHALTGKPWASDVSLAQNTLVQMLDSPLSQVLDDSDQLSLWETALQAQAPLTTYRQLLLCLNRLMSVQPEAHLSILPVLCQITEKLLSHDNRTKLLFLSDYVSVCANLCENYYPYWLYRREFLPIMNLQDYPDSSYTLHSTLTCLLEMACCSQSHIRLLAGSLLSDLLTLPVCTSES